MLLRLINAAGRRFMDNGFSWLRLDEQFLLRKACERTGLEDYGDDGFREGLRVLFQSYETVTPNSASSAGSASTATPCGC